MQSQSYSQMKTGELIDQTSNSRITVQKGHIIVQNMQSGKLSKHLLPPLKYKDQKSSYALPLKFVSKGSNVTLNPSGNILTCKSLTFQQVQMNKNFSKQITYWQLYVPQRTPLFSVGVKSQDLKKSHVFDFSIARPTTLTFRLDLQKKLFTCWFNGILSEWHKPIQIEDQSSWTPFVRVKQNGTNIILNSIVTDPETSTINFSNSYSNEDLPHFSEPNVDQTSNASIRMNDQPFSLQKLTNDKIILVGQNALKVLTRNANDAHFDFSFSQFHENDDNFVVSFSLRQFEEIREFSKKLNCNLLGFPFNKLDEESYALSINKEEWIRWVSSSLRSLNILQQKIHHSLKANLTAEVSLQEINSVAKIILSKAQSVNPFLQSSERLNSLYSEFSRNFGHTACLPYFEQPETSFIIPKELFLNNIPFIKFNSEIAIVRTTDNQIIGCLLKEGNRISIVNAQQIPFKVIDTVLSRGFAKQSEINQYKKEIQEINDNDFTKPHIFKILKNCLKYADKIKPPEKLINEIEKKKEVIQQKKVALEKQKQKKQTPVELAVDKSLLSTLIMMGFNEKVSTKALTESKNQSLEAALDLILNKYKDENTQVVPETKSKPKREWQCQVCTLINSKDVAICSACEAPAPPEAAFDEIEIVEKKQEQEIKRQQQKQQEVVSKSIQNESIKSFFIWNTRIPYCPVLIAGAFQSKIRFRLVGPNPKYYSTFYIKDNGYFDLTTLQSHEFAHQLDQEQISHKFYLTSSPEEQRKANWGWMNIEDWDLQNEGIVESIEFDSKVLNDKKHEFVIVLKTEKGTTQIDAKIVLQNVYEEKKRCFIVGKSRDIIKFENKKQSDNVLEKKLQYQDSDNLIVSQKSTVVAEFASISDKFQSFQLPQIQTLDKPSLKNQLIHLISIQGSYNAEFRYPQISLQSLPEISFNRVQVYRNGIIFKHPQNKIIKVSSVKIQERSKKDVENLGFFYLANDLAKQPVTTYPFSLKKQDGGKVTVNLNGQQGIYLVLVLNPRSNEQKAHLSYFAAYGEVVNQEKQNYSLTFLEKQLRVKFQNEQLNQKPLSQLLKVRISLVNYPTDIMSLPEGEIERYVQTLLPHGTPLNFRITLSPLKKTIPQAKIVTMTLENCKPLSRFTSYTSQQSLAITSQQYLTYLQSFIATGQTQYFDLITKQQNKQYRNLIEKVDLKDFIYSRLIACPYDRRERSTFRKFVQTFGKHLKDSKNLVSQEQVRKAFESPKLTAYGSQLLFSLIKIIGSLSLQQYFKLLSHQLQDLIEMKSQSNLTQSKNLSQHYFKQKSIFSDLFHRLASKEKGSSSSESQIHYHYLLKKSHNTRKYIVDLMSSYSLENLELKFQPSKQRSKLIVEIAYVNEKSGQQVNVGKWFYQECLWSQLFTNSKHPQSLIFNFSNVKTRYVIVSLSFSAIPFVYHKRQQDLIPSNEIIPIVHGSYIGESDAFLKSKFQVVGQNLHLLKKVDNFSKYSLKDHEALFYYNSEEVQQQDSKAKKVELNQLQKKDDTFAQRELIVNALMKNPSRKNVNFNLTLLYLLIEAAIQKTNATEFSESRLEFITLEHLAEHILNSEKGLITEKLIHLLRKIISQNNQILLNLLKVRIANQAIFSQLFKDLNILDNKPLMELIQKVICKENFQKYKNMILNLSWITKIYTFDIKIVENLVQNAVEAGQFEQVSSVFTKYGWTAHTEQILQNLIKSNRKEKLQQIISSSKSNSQLSVFGFKQLETSNIVAFQLVLKELSEKSRNTKIQDLKEIVSFILKTIIETNDQTEKRQHYLNVLGLLNKFGHTEQLLIQVFQVFFSLEERNAYANELLTCSFLKERKEQQLLLRIALEKLSPTMSKKDTLSLLNDILAFILHKEQDVENQKIHFSLSKSTEKIVLQFFSCFLKNVLNIGGLESVKLIDESLSQKIKIAFYLSVLLQTSQIFAQLAEVPFEQLTRWAMLNINTSQKQLKTANCSRFAKIEELIWRVIQVKGKKTPEQFAKIYISLYKQLRETFRSINNPLLRYSHFRKLYVFNIQVLIRFGDQKVFLTQLQQENSLFVEVLREFSSLQTSNLSQSNQNEQLQIVNEMKVYPESKQKPMDWLIYKNGSKNHVYKIAYSKSTQQVYDLTLTHQQQFTLSKIIFAFKLDITTEKNVCLPKQIRVEGGPSLDKMRFIGQMFQIKDDRYINFSVKLFGLNTNILRQNILTQLNKSMPIKYLRFKIRSPEPVSIEDALATEGSQQTNSISLVNFLSVQGYKSHTTCPYTSELVQYLEILSKVQHKQLINSLFSTQQVISAFKSALLNISYLMKLQKYQKVLHNFLMRICQQNTTIGNEMIEKYLQLQNSELCSKISAQIVLSNDKELLSRAKIYFDFITKVLLESKNFPQEILPFMNRFVQISFYAMTRPKYQPDSIREEVALICDSEVVRMLLQKLQQKNSSFHHESVVSKFLRNILTLSAPFSVAGFKLENVLQKLFARKNKLYDDILCSLIVDNLESRQWFMQNKYFEKIFDDTFSLIKSSQSTKLINANIQFLTILSYNSNIKQLINKYQYNLKLFEMMMSKNYESLLSKPENDTLRKNFVELIARTSLGSENQTVIASLLKDSIPNIISQGNQKFVGQIFLPLLNSYEKVQVCLLPYSQAQNKLIPDISSTDINSTGQPRQKIAIGSPKSTSFRLPSSLASDQMKKRVFEQLQKSTYESGNFNLAINHGQYTANLGSSILTKVFTDNQQPLLLLIKTRTHDSSKSHTTCLFYNRKSKQDQSSWTKGSFLLFSETSGNNTKFALVDKQPEGDKAFIQFEYSNGYSDDSDSDEEIGSLILKFNGKTWVEISYFYESSNYFSYQELRLENKQLESFTSNEILDSVEYWLLDGSSSENVSKPVSAVESTTTASLTQSLLSTNYDNTLFSHQYIANPAISNLRYEKVYEFPSSITASQLKESLRIINCSLDEKRLSELKILLVGSKDSLGEESKLEEIKKKSGNKDVIVLDMNLTFDNIINLMNMKDHVKKEDVDFLPRKPILKYFEENDGIQAMIKVIKKSIESWKNKQRMEKWLQYVTELQNFSHFPHFFSIYLKDKQTFRLLFNLLAGLPDKQTDTKWDELESSSSQKLLKIVSEILHMDKTSEFRQYALKNEFFSTILERLRILTGLFKRKFEQDVKEEEEEVSPSKNNQTQDDGTKKIKKKKGVGYGNDSSSNTNWMKGEGLSAKKKEFEVVQIILNIIENFLDIRHWKMPDTVLHNIFESALLPFIEDGLRAGTLLEISKHPQKFKAIFKIIKVFAKHERLVPVLLPLGINYQPRQIQSVQSLLKSLQNIASIFLSCLNQNKTNQTKQEKDSEELAHLIKTTYILVQEAIEQYNENHTNTDNQEKQLQEILELPLDKKYRALMKDLRFDYIDMKQSPTKIKHHYSTSFSPNYTPNQTKMIRLAQELADISTALPFEHTNGIYVRCDKDRVDFMQALIMGSNGTPYGHGAFLFDVYFDDNYPNNPPKVNLTTTGHGKVRFNPNLYACGKVCLSLLGTWRGSASENWDAKVSTLLQVLLSIQAIIMSEEVYFNEPGFENEQGTEEGEKKNEAYSNIVRYCNIKFAMIDNIRNPPKGFETVIRRHFYLKKDEIMQECRKWQKYAEKRAANYIGLVNDHNHSWSNEFKKTKTTYKEMLDQAIKELQEELNKLSPPKITDIVSTKQTKKKEKKAKQTNKLQELQKEQSQQIDVSYDKNLMSQAKEIDITDEKVKDRWSRYIGAMGIDAVSKQSKADILVIGLGPMALQVVKNLVLSGCRKLTICDDQNVQPEDLAGGFFYTQEDIGKKRLESILYKIRQLNVYVKIDTIPYAKVTQEVLKTYSLVLCTALIIKEQVKIADTCRQNKVKFISADSIGFTCRIVNDLGDKFQVLDKNGQEPVQVFVKDITTAEKGVVTLLDGVKNPFEDGEAVLIRNVQGMKSKQEQTKSINDTIHKVKIINSKSFEIGSTLSYTPYIRNGTIKNIKTPVELSYKPFSEIVLDSKNVLVDENLAFYDFTKLENSKLVKTCYLALDEFRSRNEGKYLEAWNAKDLEAFVQIYKTINGETVEGKNLDFVRKFALTCKGYLPPLCAFFGGLVCQEIIKAITQKYKPILSEFYIEFNEIVPSLPEQLTQANLEKIYAKQQSRDIGFEIVIGNQLLQVIKDSKLFMIGSGAIGCELLKNFAMIGFGTGQKGKITLTDPDHIENSNLNRQFLFREKHISKSKSRTASQAVKLMNPSLKNHITALTERVSDSTKDIFTNKFFEGLTLVANALDNVAARRYVDQRCVQNKVPLFQSGTLGPKGHVQVIIPYLTESYGSQNDPVEEGEIPHCTLKMFPEQTLHCVEWARDIFGKKFSLQPKALLKVIDKAYKPEKDDIKSLNDSLTMVKKGPKTFEDCINYAIHKFYKYFRDDIMQLLYTYPLDAKTKNGEPFWKLPKRPPTPLKQFEPQNSLHSTFVSTLAVMIAKIYQIDYPKNFRSETERLNIGKMASKVKIAEFVPSDEKAKEILKESSEKKEQNAEEEKTEETMQEKDQNQLYKEIITTGGHEFKIKAEQFEKDDDANGHIDFIYSMANLRAINYKLDPMQWINVKIKAGRIVPALATTTACVSGLQTLEICKYLKKVKVDTMRNSYLNLAVPSIQMSQPGQVFKKKITEKLTVNLWDRWDIQLEKSATFGNLYEALFKKFEIFPIGILQGMSRIDTGKSQEAKKAFLAQKILDKLDLQENYIDIIVLFTKTQEDDKIIEGVPPVRLLFN